MFGGADCNRETTEPFTRLNVIAMQIQGLWPVARFGKKTALLHRTFGVFITLCYGFFTATMFVDVVMSRGNLEALSGNLSISLLYLSGIAKAIAFLFTRSSVGDLVDHTVKFSLRIRRSGDSELLKILDEHVKQGNFVTLCFWISAALTISGYCGLPIIDVVAGTKTEPSRLIFRAWNPFPDIWPGYFLQLTMSYLTGVITASWSTLMAVLIIVPTCEMKVLGIELQGIIKTASLRERKDREIQESVKNWVKKHLGVIRYVEKLDRILNRLLLFDFVIYSGIFCTTFFQYIVLGLRYEIVVASSYMVAMAIQIMMIYWTGNEVIIHSESLVDAAYNGIWYRAPVWYTMTIKIIMQRCRKPLKLRVWKLYKVSTETCLTIAKTAYSYFAILRHIYFKK